MKQIVSKIKPASGFGHIFHALSLILLPTLLFVLIRIDFVELAVVLVLMSKWRIFAVRTRHWLANIRASSIDVFVGVSIVLLMANTGNQLVQLLLAASYALWLIVIKPKSSPSWVGAQALIGQTLSLQVVYSVWADKSIFWLTASVGLICLLSARHFLSSFDETMARAIGYCWAYVGASVAWLTAHWLIFYGPIAQPVLLITVAGYGMAALYYLQYKDRLSHNVRRQVVIVVSAVIFFIIMFSGHTDKVIQ